MKVGFKTNSKLDELINEYCTNGIEFKEIQNTEAWKNNFRLAFAREEDLGLI